MKPYDEYLSEWFPALDRTRGKCCYCEVKLTRENRSKEHIIPQCRGGTQTLPCCKTCNNARGCLPLEVFAKTEYALANGLGRNIEKLKQQWPGA